VNSSFISHKTLLSSEIPEVLLESCHLVMLLSILTFALSMRCIQSSESSPRNQPLYMAEPHVLLHQKLMSPFLNSQLQDHYESATSKKMATAIRETETTVDGYYNSVQYNRLGCQGAVFSVSSISLNHCFNSSSTEFKTISSYKYSFTSQTSNATMTIYYDDKCQSPQFIPVNIPARSCYFGIAEYYSPTMTLPTLPTEPYARSS
jgi:hypothetical protein